MQNDYQDLQYPEPRKSCCKQYCGWKAAILYTVCAIVFIVVGVVLAFIGFYVISKGDICDVPKPVCKGSPPSTTGFYNIEKGFFNNQFTYMYAANFQSNYTVNFNDTQIDLGTMNLCVQTKGSQAVGPFNCSMNYMYDYSTCAFHYLTGDCDQNVAHKSTDNKITGMQFLPSNDTLLVDFQSHSQITGGTYNLTKGDTPVINCSPVTDPVPKDICKDKAPKSFFEKLDFLKSDDI